MSTPVRRPVLRLVAPLSALVLGSLALTGCKADVPSVGGDNSADEPSSSASQTPSVQVTTNVARSGVPITKTVSVTAADGTLKQVTVEGFRTAASTDDDDPGELSGELSADGSTWQSTGRLEPGSRYVVSTTAVDGKGQEAQTRYRFTTQKLPLDQQTFPSIAPLGGQTVGVGMPVIVKFDVPVTNKAEIEKHLTVDSQPVQQGSWHWISDNEVHWRPKTYWKAGTDVTVHADVNSIPAGNGVFGQLSRTTKFHVGRSVIMRTDVAKHEMRVLIDGKLARTIPVTAGQPGFTTRSGVKVIIEKLRTHDMDARTIGIEPGDPNYYNMSNVEYAQRVTYSGEFIHAAPWSTGDQGSTNVSHGCVGMSTANAAWLFSVTKVGDVVDVTGTDRHMTLTNGYGDWNESFATYKQGSAVN